MEGKRQIRSGRWFQKILISTIFGLFMMATVVHAQLLGLGAPAITVQPVGTNVQNGDTITFTVSANCTQSLGGTIGAVTWHFNNGNLPTNAIVGINGMGSQNVSSTLTLTHVSGACAGNYSVDIEDQLLGGILGLTTAWAYSQNAPLVVTTPPTPVAAVVGGSKMMTITSGKGFKCQFSGPIGSNLVIEATSDMGRWSPIYTNVVTASGTLSYTDSVPQTASCRFYRAKLK